MFFLTPGPFSLLLKKTNSVNECQLPMLTHYSTKMLSTQARKALQWCLVDIWEHAMYKKVI